jgi:hypothetical protein
MARGKLRVGQTGILPGYKGFRRYGGINDAPMQKSNNFRRSWMARVQRRRFRVASILGNELVSNITRGRPVLELTASDRRAMRRRTISWIRRHK